MTVRKRADELVHALEALGVNDMRVTLDVLVFEIFVDIYQGPEHVDCIVVDPDKGFGFFPVDTVYSELPELWVADVPTAIDAFKKRNNIS